MGRVSAGAFALASAATAFGLALGCLLQLEHQIACGDGFVDPEAGEECDPADPASYENACLDNLYGGGVGDCHPETCTIIADDVQCRYCGDGDLAPPASDGGSTGDMGEECDGLEFSGSPCPAGGTPICTEECKIDESKCLPYCGDEMLLGDEECGDEGVGGIMQPRACAGDELTSPIPSPHPGIPYGSGFAPCVQCRWDRDECSYCGNGTRDAAVELYDEGPVSPEEWCDGDQFDYEKLTEVYGTGCQDAYMGGRPNVECAPGCYDFVERTGGPCCVRTGGYCPPAGGDLQCCYAYEHDADEDPCVDHDPSPRLCK